eukprot:scaffold11320_cov121-Isochrysis_galbana.AAC.3
MGALPVHSLGSATAQESAPRRREAPLLSFKTARTAATTARLSAAVLRRPCGRFRSLAQTQCPIRIRRVGGQVAPQELAACCRAGSAEDFRGAAAQPDSPNAPPTSGQVGLSVRASRRRPPAVPMLLGQELTAAIPPGRGLPVTLGTHRVCREGEADGGGLGIGITTDADGAVGGGDGARHRVESNSVRHSRGQVRLVPGLEDAHALLIGEHLEAERVEVGDQDVQHVVLQAGGDADVGVRSAVLEGVGHDLVQGELGHGDVDGDEASDGRYQRAAAGQGGLQERDEGHGRAVGDVGVLL